VAPTAPSSSARPWLFGAFPDLILGCGVGYAAIFALQMAAGPELRAAIPAWAIPLVLIFASWPHHGATLLIAYEQEENRRKYAFFTLWSTLVVWGAFTAGVYSAPVGSLLITFYVTWIPWHFMGQNYGIALMFARRIGVDVSPNLKRVVYASFFLSFALMFLATHGGDAVGRRSVAVYDSGHYAILRLPIPPMLKSIGMSLVASAYGLTTLVAVGSLLGRAPLRKLVPVLALFASQSLWIAVPVLSLHYGVLLFVDPLSPMNQAYATVVVAVAHGVQYMWITSYYALRSDPPVGVGRHFGKALLAGCGIWTLPALLFAPSLLGRVPYSEGLGALVAAAVNLHHFVLDGAIWKLRDRRVANILLRPSERAPQIAAPVGTRRLSFARMFSFAPVVWAVGAACLVASLLVGIDNALGARAMQRGRTAIAEASLKRLSWVGRDSPSVRANLGVVKASQGDVEGGRAEVERSLALYATPEAWRAKAFIHEGEGELLEAIHSYRESLKLGGSWRAQNNLAWIRAVAPDPALSNAEEAVALAEAAAIATKRRNPGVLDTLAAAYASAYRLRAAVRVAKRAEQLAAAGGDEEFAAAIAERRALYQRGERYREAAPTGARSIELDIQVKLY
jgi:tetratricopeptide (TPR) repeat protein